MYIVDKKGLEMDINNILTDEIKNYLYENGVTYKIHQQCISFLMLVRDFENEWDYKIELKLSYHEFHSYIDSKVIIKEMVNSMIEKIKKDV